MALPRKEKTRRIQNLVNSNHAIKHKSLQRNSIRIDHSWLHSIYATMRTWSFPKNIKVIIVLNLAVFCSVTEARPGLREIQELLCRDSKVEIYHTTHSI